MFSAALIQPRIVLDRYCILKMYDVQLRSMQLLLLPLLWAECTLLSSFLFLENVNQMFSIGDAAIGEIKAILRKCKVAVEKQVILAVEEICVVQGRVTYSVEWAVEDTVKDVKDALVEVTTAMEEATGVAKKTIGGIMLLP